MSDQVKKDLISYMRRIIQSGMVLISLFVCALLCAWIFKMNLLIGPLFGALMGALFATINLFALGYAFYGLYIRQAKRWLILWPLSSFTTMCVAAFVLAIYFYEYIFGFALGLTVPVLFGMVIVSGSSKPA
jgi:hypothetical protein